MSEFMSSRMGSKTSIINNLSFLTFASALAFWGIAGVVVTDIATYLKLSPQKAIYLSACLISVQYGFAVIAGYIADFLVDKKTSITLGMVVLILGMVLVIVMRQNFMIPNLIIITLGFTIAEIVKHNLINDIFPGESEDRDKAYNYTFAALNISAVVGPLLFGILSRKYSIEVPFIIVGIVNLIALFYFNNLKLALNNQIKKNQKLKALLVFIVCFALALGMANSEKFSDIIILAISSFGIVFLSYLVLNSKTKNQRTNIIKIIGYIALTLVFFSLSLQIINTLAHSFSVQTNRILFGYEIPGSALFASQGLFSAIAGYLIPTILKKRFSLGNRAVFGLTLGIFSLYLFSSFFKDPNIQIALWLPILACFFMGVGEALVFPTVSSAITNLAPNNLQGTLFGINVVAMALAGRVSGIVGVFLVLPSGQLDLGKLSSTYLFTLLAAILLLVIINRGYLAKS